MSSCNLTNYQRANGVLCRGFCDDCGWFREGRKYLKEKGLLEKDDWDEPSVKLKTRIKGY